MAELRFTILGCGSSGGVPRLGGLWGECDPGNPKNTRRRCSLLVQRIGADGTTNVLIDTSPDLRSQLLDAGIGRLDGVVYSHAHADHVHGIDDLRMIVFNMRSPHTGLGGCGHDRCAARPVRLCFRAAGWVAVSANFGAERHRRPDFD